MSRPIKIAQMKFLSDKNNAVFFDLMSKNNLGRGNFFQGKSKNRTVSYVLYVSFQGQNKFHIEEVI